MTPTLSPTARTASDRRRVHSAVALAVLETLRSQDLPPEILHDENLTLTLPRRLGLSDVIDAQIRRYRADARRGRRVSEQEIMDLLRLVIRRPDSEEVFLEVGRQLHRSARRSPVRRFLPRRMVLAGARRRVDRRLRALFGRRMVRGSGRRFVLDAQDPFLVEGDPGGDACALVTGLAAETLDAYSVPQAVVVHSRCRGRGDEACRWELKE